jgi:Ni,Fe-hydrogenase maturation factor
MTAGIIEDLVVWSEVQDILDKVKKYGNLRVHSLRYLIPQTEADELLSEIQEDVEELAQQIVRLKELLVEG